MTKLLGKTTTNSQNSKKDQNLENQNQELYGNKIIAGPIYMKTAFSLNLQKDFKKLMKAFINSLRALTKTYPAHAYFKFHIFQKKAL